jgi:hypothetical protein
MPIHLVGTTCSIMHVIDPYLAARSRKHDAAHVHVWTQGIACKVGVTHAAGVNDPGCRSATDAVCAMKG